MLGTLCPVLGPPGLRNMDDPGHLHHPRPHHHFLSGTEEMRSLKMIAAGLFFCRLHQVRIFKEIHRSLYRRSESRLSPTPLPLSRQDSQSRGGRAGGGRSDLPVSVSPLTFYNPGSPNTSDGGSALQMNPVRSGSASSQTKTSCAGETLSVHL